MSWNDCPICGKELYFNKDRISIACREAGYLNSYGDTLSHYEVDVMVQDKIVYSEYSVIGNLEIQRMKDKTIIRCAIDGFSSAVAEFDSVLPLDIERIKKLMVLV